MAGPCLIFAALGPNPAPLTELIWKLARSGRFSQFEAHLVVERTGLHYLEGELLAPNGALDQLRRVLGPAFAISPPVVHEVRASSGELIGDDADPESFRDYSEALWTAARIVTESAGDRPVVFGLIAGRRRTMTALASSVYQLLARPIDRLVDVRVSDSRVEGGTGFFFPEQPGRRVQSKQGNELVDASAVDIMLVDVPVPRLRAFVPSDALASFEAARVASQRVLADAAPPKLEIVASTGEVRVDGELMPIAPSPFVWFSYLAVERAVGEGWVAVRDLPRLRVYLARLAEHPIWDKLPPDSPYAIVLQGGDDGEDDLGNFRGKTAQAASAFARKRRPALRQLVPQSRKRQIDGGAMSFQRLPLDPAFIELSW